MSDASPSNSTPPPAVSLGDLPPDELWRYGCELGLDLDRGAPPDEMVRCIRQRQELLVELDRDALLDIVVWARKPVRKSVGKEQLVKEIARIEQTNYRGLTARGLFALARLRGVKARETDNSEHLIDRLRKQDGLWKRISCKRRAVVGSLLSKIIEGKTGSEGDEEYRFLPDDTTSMPDSLRRSIKEDVTERGIVGGIAQRIRGAADDYIRVKLDEIEARIDEKLDQIDRRLAEWRDREIANRLKILRITLVFTALVAVLSLGYNYIKNRTMNEPAPTAGEVTPSEPSASGGVDRTIR